MAVYVDNAREPFGRMIMCHMVADDRAELDAMADRLGIKRKWFHRGHYNICWAKRAEAIGAGAMRITTRKAVEIRRGLEAVA